MTSWSIAVKTVGAQSLSGVSTRETFTVCVSPDDHLKSLHDRIESVTGLKACQQRLIYRGRLISGGSGAEETSSDSVTKNEPKIRDVIGLGDGQTIHLVPRLDNRTEASNRSSNSQSSQSNSTPQAGTEESAGSGSGAGALVAALLRLGMDEDGGDDQGSTTQQLPRFRSPRIRRNQRNNYRLTQADLETADPGSLEPVRQGMMTMHTLLNANNPEGVRSGLRREWFRGQWIDCRDTVNQWLEATVVDIIKPEEILPSHLQNTSANSCQQAFEPTSDPAVSANDLEGRMRLLLEPADGHANEDQWGGYRQRDNNKGVQLLLVHYNGWPHRWDEWIRSDSERIRPFRTRTRHPTSSSTACPTPQSAFHAAPSTQFVSGDEAVERQTLLPELSALLAQVNDMVSKASSAANNFGTLEEGTCGNGNLPWRTRSRAGADFRSALDFQKQYERYTFRRQLLPLAPLLDRLGRTLIDAAPHIHAYAASLPERRPSSPHDVNYYGSNVVVADADGSDDGNNLSESHDGDEMPALMDSDQLFSDLFPYEDEDLLEPDYVDFVNGGVNTTRGEVRRRGSRNTSSEDGASLLRAYLAAASLSSLVGDEEGSGEPAARVRARGNGGNDGTGGIDIHIHAFVTGPGVGNGGGLGVAVLGDPQLAQRTPSTNVIGQPETAITAPPQESEEDLGIFADLYSESPVPINLVSPSVLAESGEATGVVELDDTTEVSRVEATTTVDNVVSIPGEDGGSPRRRNGLFGRLFRRGGRRR